MNSSLRLLVTTFLLPLGFPTNIPANQQQHSASPNIVLILADDQAWMDFGFMGSERVHTPNLDELAANGATFTNGYVPSSVCRPSLATVLTGLYPHQHRIHFNHGPPGNAGYNQMTSRKEYQRVRDKEFELIRRCLTLPSVLAKEKGYRCLQTGKFWEGHYTNAGFTDGMTTFKTPPLTQAFGGIRTLASGEKVAHGNGDAGLQIGRVTMQPIERFVDECETSNTPWLVWYAPYLPHLPHDAPAKFAKLASNQPGVLPQEIPYFASIAQFDATVGELVNTVKKSSSLQETIFVFLSDNGWRPSSAEQSKRPGEFGQTKRSKRSPFDDGLRTPILIRWDGVIEPQTRHGLVSSVDVMPTLLKAAGVPTERFAKLPGLDLFSLLQTKKMIPQERTIFGEVYPGDATELNQPENDIAYRWMRQSNFKLIYPHALNESANSSQSESGYIKAWNAYVSQISLFDVQMDPFEKINLSSSPKFQSTLERMVKILNEWWLPGD